MTIKSNYYRAGVQKQVQSEELTIGSSGPLPEIVSGQDDHDYESYNDLEKKDPLSDGQDAQYDSDGFPITETSKKDGDKSRIEPLPSVDHSTISYRPFKKRFYSESAETKSMTDDDIASLREELEVNVSGSDVPKPVKSFQVSCLPPLLLKEISKVGFERPTSIQAQALPIALSGRDLIGLAKTGSGIHFFHNKIKISLKYHSRASWSIMTNDVREYAISYDGITCIQFCFICYCS